MISSTMNRDRGRARRLRIGAATGAAIAVSICGVAVIAHADGSPPPSPTPAPRTNPSKAQRLQYERDLVAWSRAHPRPKPSLAQGRAQAERAAKKVAPTRRVAGIISMHQGPFAPSQFSVSNFYQGPADGTWLLVYSGAVRNPVSGKTIKGAVRIYAMPHPNGGMTELGTFSPNPAVGALRIVKADGQHLVLTSDGRHKLDLNLDTDRFAPG